MENTVVLGLPGDLIDSYSEKTCLVTKVGGSLWIPEEICSCLKFEQIQCCNTTMSLIFQSYVPVLGKQRWLVVLGCTKCNNSWKVFRIQKDQNIIQPTEKINAKIETNQQQNQLAQQHAQNLELFQNKILTDVDFSGNKEEPKQNLNDTVSSDHKKEPQQNQNNVDFSDLNFELDKLLSFKNNPNKNQNIKQNSKKVKNSNQNQQFEQEKVEEITLGPQIPSFYIHAIDEPKKGTLTAQEKQHINKLIKEYEQREAEEEDQEEPKFQDGKSKKANKSNNNNNNNNLNVNQGEEYEKQQLENIDYAMLKFLKRVNRSPQQCARYGFHGQCIWPGEINRKNIPKCAICQQDRVFELQLMSPLISCLQECCEWLREGGEQNKQLIKVGLEAVEKWQWLSMACYVCGKNCQVEGKVCYEEHVMLFNE